MKALMKIRDFRLLWFGQATSSLGDAITNLALLITAQRLTGSVTAVAATAIAIALPQLLVGMLAGVYVDRWDRRKVMIASDFVRGVLVLGFMFVSTPDRLWLMYAVAFLQAGVGTFFNPARAALMPAIVGRDNLMAANSISESTRITFGVVGTAVAGVYAGVATSLAVLFVVDAATFIVSAILEMRIRTSGRPPAAAEHHLWNELKAGLAVITRTRPLVSVLVGAGVAMLGFGAVNVLIVPFVISDLGIAESWFGAFEAAQVVSMVAAGALVAALAKKVKPAVVLAVGLLGVGGVLALFGGVQAGWQLVVLMFLIGWFITPVQASAHTILQQEVAPEALGRAGAGFSTVATTANVVSMALAGTAAALVGIRGVFVVSGILGAAAGLLTYSLNRTPASANAGLRALESTSSTQG